MVWIEVLADHPYLYLIAGYFFFLGLNIR